MKKTFPFETQRSKEIGKKETWGNNTDNRKHKYYNYYSQVGESR